MCVCVCVCVCVGGRGWLTLLQDDCFADLAAGVGGEVHYEALEVVKPLLYVCGGSKEPYLKFTL